MNNVYRVLLPKWVFNNADSEQDILAQSLYYMQRYPHYDLLRIENGFAICHRLND